MKIIYAITIGVMFLLAAEDVRTKELDWWKLGMLACICLIGCICMPQKNLWSMAGGGMIGLCMIGISFLSKEQIGIGDGIVTGLLGCLLGARGCLVMLCIASCLMAVISIGILILKRAVEGQHCLLYRHYWEDILQRWRCLDDKEKNGWIFYS